MTRTVKRTMLGIGLILVVGIAAMVLYVYVQCSRFDASLDEIYDVPVPAIARSTDGAVLARGTSAPRRSAIDERLSSL
jgi:hypothetical protein